MEHIAYTLNQGPQANPEMVASRVVAAANEEIKERGILSTEARAVSFKNGGIIIRANHPAVAAVIRRDHKEILGQVNATILRRHGGPVVEKVVVRVS